MGEVDALAHRLAAGGRIAVAQRRAQQRFHLGRALAAGRRRLGLHAHVVERGQALGGDRLRDRALADAVAAADLRVVRQGRDRRHRIERRAAALVGLAEDQHVAHRRDVGALLQQVEIPGAVGGIAIEHGADDAVVAQDDALVDAARGIAQHDLVLLVAFRKVARREQIDAGDLELGRGGGAGVAADLLAGERGAERLGHLVQRRDQPVALAAMLDAFADREDVLVVGAQQIVDHEAALDLETRLPWRARCWGECRPP